MTNNRFMHKVFEESLHLNMNKLEVMLIKLENNLFLAG